MNDERRQAARTAEVAVISALMQWPEVADDVLPGLQAAHLGDQRHAPILEAVRRMRSRGQIPTPPGLEAELEARGDLARVGADYLYQVYDAVAVADHVHDHLRMVRGFARLRGLAREAAQISQAAAAASWDEADALGQRFEQALDAFHAQASDREPLAFLPDMAQAYAERRAPELVGIREAQPPGMTTGLATLDRAMVWRPGQVYTLTAASGGGKSTLAWFLAGQAALISGRASLYFSIEMPGSYLTIRHLSSRSGVLTNYLERGPLSRADVLEIKGASVSAPPVFVHDKGTGTSISVVERSLRQVIRDGWTPGLVVIDLLARYELPEGERRGASRQDDVTRLVRYAATMAARYHVPVLSLSQVNRDGALRESDAPAHDSDTVMELAADKPNRRARLLFKKSRFGMPSWDGDAIELGFDPTTGRFYDLEVGAGWGGDQPPAQAPRHLRGRRPATDPHPGERED